MGSTYITKKWRTYFRYPSDCVTVQVDSAWNPIGTPTVWCDTYKPIETYGSMTTRGNPGWNRRSGSSQSRYHSSGSVPNFDSGGDWSLKKYEVLTREYGPVRFGSSLPGIAPRVLSNVVADSVALSGWVDSGIENRFPTIPSNASLDALGASLAAIVSPVNPRAGLAQTLIELKREGLPSIKAAVLNRQSLRKLPKAIGEDWLNLAFGWLPLFRDIQRCAQALLDAEHLTRQFLRDSGRLVRRRTGVKTDIIQDDHTESYGRYGAPGFNAYNYPSGGGRFTESVLVERSTWFSGAFKYYVPSGDSLLAQLTALNVESRYLLGLSFDPATIWNVIGFSWLADWVFNVGPVLENFTERYINQLVMPYGYVMSETVKTRSLFLDQLSMWDGGTIERAYVERWSVKNRRASTPFGFGKTWTGFTPFQLSILAALGVTHRR